MGTGNRKFHKNNVNFRLDDAMELVEIILCIIQGKTGSREAAILFVRTYLLTAGYYGFIYNISELIITNLQKGSVTISCNSSREEEGQ